MRTFGIIGFPLSHSFSQKYFTEKFNTEKISGCKFRNFQIEDINEFPELIKNNSSLNGLSVTTPHKQTVIKYLNEIDPTAKRIGAVNCVKIGEKLIGYNTDVYGFEESLKPLLKPHTKALVLGSGGASKAVEFVLRKLQIEHFIVSRKKNQKKKFIISYSDLTEQIIAAHTLIINTTPLGMFPNINECPDVPYQLLTSKHLLFDLVYNPDETLFLKKGKAKGAQIKNGFEMLQLQADKAWEIWNM